MVFCKPVLNKSLSLWTSFLFFVHVFTPLVSELHPSQPVSPPALQKGAERRNWQIVVVDDQLQRGEEQADESEAAEADQAEGGLPGEEEGQEGKREDQKKSLSFIFMQAKRYVKVIKWNFCTNFKNFWYLNLDKIFFNGSETSIKNS